MDANKSPGSLAPRRILIVDDELDICNLFVRIVKGDLPDCRVDMAVNGLEAVSTFREGHHSILLMDLHMPVMDGYTAFMEIQKLCAEENLEMPAVIFCTGYAPPLALEQFLAKTPRHCLLHKPASIEVLLRAIKARL
jgi:CheY-like chemotaxis protein